MEKQVLKIIEDKLQEIIYLAAFLQGVIDWQLFNEKTNFKLLTFAETLPKKGEKNV